MIFGHKIRNWLDDLNQTPDKNNNTVINKFYKINEIVFV